MADPARKTEHEQAPEDGEQRAIFGDGEPPRAAPGAFVSFLCRLFEDWDRTCETSKDNE